jgi:hypothetical protein
VGETAAISCVPFFYVALESEANNREQRRATHQNNLRAHKEILLIVMSEKCNGMLQYNILLEYFYVKLNNFTVIKTLDCHK